MSHRTVAIIGMAAALLVYAVAAMARDNGQYANVDPAVREWYRTRQLTPEAQKRIPFKSCCDAADVVRTKFRVGEAGADVWEWLNGDKWQRIPDDIIHRDEFSPGGEAVLFAVGGQPVCFFLPQGGI
jgi:hypothetical protein